MTLDPSSVGRLLQGVAAPVDQDARRQEARLDQARLTMAATLAAARSTCNCETCQVMRRLVDYMIAEAKVGGDPGAPGVNPPS